LLISVTPIELNLSNLRELYQIYARYATKKVLVLGRGKEKMDWGAAGIVVVKKKAPTH